MRGEPPFGAGAAVLLVGACAWLAAESSAAEGAAAAGPASGAGEGGSAAGPAAYSMLDLDIGRDATDVHWGRRGPDALLDLFVLSPGAVRIWEQASSGFPAAPTEQLRLPEDASLVDFGDVAGGEGEEVVLVNRRGVFADGAGLEPPPPGRVPPAGTGSPPPGEERRPGAFHRILAVQGIPAPLEHVRAALARDVSGDGRADLIVPVRGGYEIHFRRGAGFENGVFLEGEQKVTVDAGGPEVLDPLKFEVRIPHLKLKDLNGDGRLDILARSRDRIRCYLQDASGFKPRPSYELDLSLFQEGGAAERDRKGGRKRQGSALGGAIKVHEVDIDGDGVQDYLVASGQLLRVYFGSKEGADFTRPHTMLKLSSELQGVGSFDIDGDGRLDLVALKFELPGLPRLIAAYFVSMSLDFEVLGYRNDGGRRFSRRPDWRNTLSLELPPLRQVIEGFEGFADRFLEAASRRGRFAAGDADGDGRIDSAFLDDDRVLRVFLNRAGDPRPGQVKLGSILFDTKKSRWELGELLDYVASASLAAARRAVAGRAADLEVPMGGGYDPRDAALSVMDVNADGRGDFVLNCGAGKLRIALSVR